MAFSGLAGVIYIAVSRFGRLGPDDDPADDESSPTKVPETYQPFILRRRAKKLMKETGRLHVSMYDLQMGGEQKLGEEIMAYLKNPIKYLLTE